jgi:hypothetical protein
VSAVREIKEAGRSLVGESRLRLSATQPGRAILTAFVLFTLVTIITANLPDSPLRGLLSTVTEPYRNAVGLNQRWNLFAPEPGRQSSTMVARLVGVEGRETTWRLPRGGPATHAYWDYRWRKWSSVLADEPDLWDEAASWLARREATRGRRLREVTLVARWSELKPPGVKPETGPWRARAFYRWRAPSHQRLGG